MDSHILKVKAAMQATAAAENLPEHYRDDLDVDYSDIERYERMELVWLLRTCGTVLFPICSGADPVFVSHWLHSSHSQTIKTFRVSTRPGAKPVTPISPDEAVKLANFPPFLPVEDVLRRGIALGIWGDTPEKVENWYDWFDFFHSAGNGLMSAYIKRSMVAACAAQ